jgi:hypothetical protein
MLTISFPMVWTIVAQPTEQYGQTLGVALASLIRSSWARAVAGARLAPNPSREPNAVPEPMPAADVRTNSRRESGMSIDLSS